MGDRLNEAQAQAVFSEDPILCCACPGSGKTTVIMNKVEHILGNRPEARIIMTTFSRDAAREMQRRLKDRRNLSERLMRQITIGTFHALALSQLRSIGRVGKVISEVESHHLIYSAMQESRVVMSIGEAEAVITLCKTDPEYAAANPEFRALSDAYRVQMDAIGASDFTDMLIMANELMASGDLEPLPATHILADEFQDIDAVQYRWLMLHIAQPANPVPTAVGDDDQSIYGFRRSLGYKGMMEFAAATGARIIHLETNYRSYAGILDAANKLIAYNLDRVDKRVKAARGPGAQAPRVIPHGKKTNPAKLIIKELDALFGDRPVESAELGGKEHRFTVKPKEAAVLARTNEALRAIEEQFMVDNVPYLRVGRSIWDLKIVKVYVAILDSLANRRSVGLEVGLRWAMVDHQTLNDLKLAGEGSLWNYLRPENPLPLPKTDSSAIRSFFKHAQQWGSKLSGRGSTKNAEFPINGVSVWMESVINGACDEDEDGNPKKTEQGKRDTTWLRQLGAVRGALMKKDGSLLQRLRKAQQMNDNEFERVVLTTFHASKGLEWDHVFLVDVHAGSVPKLMEEATEESLCEERRVFYVAMTRAADTLTIYARNDKDPSEFLEEAGLWNGLHDAQGNAVAPKNHDDQAHLQHQPTLA